MVGQGEAGEQEGPGKRFAIQQGNEITLDRPDAGPWPKRHRLLQSDKDWTVAIPWSITLDKLGVSGDWILDSPGTYAHVRWGVGGANHEAWVDWRRGTRFTINASSVTLDLYITNPQDWTGQIPGHVNDKRAGWPGTFRASMVSGRSVPQVPGILPATLTVSPAVSVDGQDFNFTDYVTIPPFARRCRFTAYDINEAQPTYWVEYWNGTPAAPWFTIRRDFIQAVTTKQYYDAETFQEIPMDATMVRANHGLVEWSYFSARFCFELML